MVSVALGDCTQAGSHQGDKRKDITHGELVNSLINSVVWRNVPDVSGVFYWLLAGFFVCFCLFLSVDSDMIQANTSAYLPNMRLPVRQSILLFALAVLFCCGCTDPQVHGHMEFTGWSFQDSTGDWRAAEVPGCIHTDLMAHGLIPDPFLLRKRTRGAVVESRDWVYRCPFPSRH